MTCDSVTMRPSISSTGSRPEGTCVCVCIWGGGGTARACGCGRQAQRQLHKTAGSIGGGWVVGWLKHVSVFQQEHGDLRLCDHTPIYL
jgi:hypothetical protein